MSTKLLSIPWLSIIVFAIVCWLTLAPIPENAPKLNFIPDADKFVHVILMFALSASMMYDYRRLRPTESRYQGRRYAWVVAIFVALFSAFDEWMQEAMNYGRSCDLIDFAADIVGIMLAVIFVPMLLSKRFD